MSVHHLEHGLTVPVLSLFLLLAVSLWLPAPAVFAQEDMAGAQDHPEIPRIEGARIRGYIKAPFDEARFVSGFSDNERLTETHGGIRTRILYIADPSLTVAGVFRNYQVALEELGDTELVFSCEDECAKDLGKRFIWEESQRIPTDISQSHVLYGSFGYRQEGYRYWLVTTDEARYHVAVYTAHLTGQYAKTVKNTRSVHLDVLEEADFEATLTVVTPEDIATGINEDGRIALYGIHFDFDSAQIAPDSTPTLESVSMALSNDPSLRIFVVGHTDNQGSYDYNLDLSKRRAKAVVDRLVTSYSISRERLQPVGIGPVSPMASNGSEAGKALNRRVELVGM